MKIFNEIKKDIHGWIILFLILIPICFLSTKGINNFLFFMDEIPFYTNLFKIDNYEMNVSLPDNWQMKVDDAGSYYLTNKSESEKMYFSAVDSASNMDVAKAMFLLSLKDSYQEIDYKEFNIEKNNRIYGVVYSVNGVFYISGVIESNDIFFDFVYSSSDKNLDINIVQKILESIGIVENKSETETENVVVDKT